MANPKPLRKRNDEMETFNVLCEPGTMRNVYVDFTQISPGNSSRNEATRRP